MKLFNIVFIACSVVLGLSVAGCPTECIDNGVEVAQLVEDAVSCQEGDSCEKITHAELLEKTDCTRQLSCGITINSAFGKENFTTKYRELTMSMREKCGDSYCDDASSCPIGEPTGYYCDVEAGRCKASYAESDAGQEDI